MAENARKDSDQSFELLREPMRKLDALLAIARKVQQDTGTVPAGLVDDFHDLRRQIEKAFVFHFQGVDAAVQESLRAFLKNTRSLDAPHLGANLDKLAQVSRSMLNGLMMQGAPTLSLEDEMADQPLPPQTPALTGGVLAGSPAAQPAPQAAPSRRRSPMSLLAAGAIVLLAGVALVIAYAAGAFSTPLPAPDNTPLVAASNNAPGNAPANLPVVDTTKPFDAAAAGYPDKLALYALDRTINPLDATPDMLLPDELPAVLLGLEELLYLLQPGRLHLSPPELRKAMREFAQGMIDAQPAWKASRKQFLDAMAAHARSKLNLVLYDNAPEVVLLSDVLFGAGGGQQSLCMALAALARCAQAPIGLYAPNGIVRPVIGVAMRDGLHTFNGDTYGLRSGMVPLARVGELLVELCTRLLPGLSEPAARVLCLAVIRQHRGGLSVEHARIGLADINLGWFSPPGENATEADQLMHRLAAFLQPTICNALLYDVAGADAAEALSLYRLAAAGSDEPALKQALLLLGQRAQRGALLDGQPLALKVGDLLRDLKKPAEALAWYKRALADHPDDPRPALRLAEALPAEAATFLRQAYARGEREPAFLARLATAMAGEGNQLGALAVLDELCRLEPLAQNVEMAVLTCLALERPDWAQKRIADNADSAKSPLLQRLDLICELQRNGLSERARTLAKAWRAGGDKDPFVENLLQRYGG